MIGLMTLAIAMSTGTGTAQSAPRAIPMSVARTVPMRREIRFPASIDRFSSQTHICRTASFFGSDAAKTLGVMYAASQSDGCMSAPPFFGLVFPSPQTPSKP